ncbi:gap junction delta-4 protein [Bombina bombina]|uniref:gap junction delta-4 protein n=1 Tax=Bombina bombina TaxID=8345 RepID=UPI00235A5373|nr:gap junction delta-4 protein [Bombina bombina]
MEYLDSIGYLLVTFNYNVTAIGKIWLTLMILLRMAMVVFAGYPLYEDEQERFTCNTLQPGCSNVCYDIFAPVSHIRYWLVQTLVVFVPYVLFIVHVSHKVLTNIATSSGHYRKSGSCTYPGEGVRMEIPDFSFAYTVHLFLRTFIEAGFCAGQYFLFGIFVPKSFSCLQTPCTSSVDCYISRPTEKSMMMIFIWGTGVISLILSVVDLVRVMNMRRKLEKLKREMIMLENDSLKGCHSNTPSQNTKLLENQEQMITYPECSNDLKKFDEQIKGDSHSLPSYEGETASFQTDNSHQDMGKSNINSNSNKACPWKVSLTSTSGKSLANEHNTVIHRQATPKSDQCSDSDLVNSTLVEKNASPKNKKSEWV